MRTIKKTIIEVVILHEKDYPIADLPTSVVIQDTIDGETIGESQILETHNVCPGELFNELVAIGNDGTFFNTEEDDE